MIRYLIGIKSESCLCPKIKIYKYRMRRMWLGNNVADELWSLLYSDYLETCLRTIGQGWFYPSQKPMCR